MIRHDCCLCSDRGAPAGCPACGKVSQGVAVAAVWSSGQEMLEKGIPGRLPCLVIKDGRAWVRVDGDVILAEVSGDPIEAIPAVVKLALQRAREAA